MTNKPNPLIAAIEAKLEAKHQANLRTHIEMDRIAFLIFMNRRFKVGPGRAYGLLQEYTDTKKEIAKMISDDIGDSYKGGDGDPEFLHTKRGLAITLKGILGPEAWEKCKRTLPMIRDYWNI